MEYLRAHPFTILNNLWRVFYLVIIPVVRGFFYALQGDFTKWVKGAWIDILILFIMIGVAVWSWLRVRYRFDEYAMHMTSGLLVRRTSHIPWSKVITLSVYNGFFLKPFHTVHLRVDTLGGSFKNADFAIYLSPRRAEELMCSVRKASCLKKGCVYAPNSFSIFALALLNSNSLAGVVFIATFFTQTGKLLGQEFADVLIGTMENVARNVAFGIPPAAAMLAYLVLLGWLVGFFFNFFRYKNMKVYRNQESLMITGGLFSQREYCMRYADIYFIDIRQSITSKLLGLFSLYIFVVGYGKDKEGISCIIPTELAPKFQKDCQLLFPAFQVMPRHLRPCKGGLLRFLSEPLYVLLGITVGMLLFIFLFPGWRSFVLFVGLMMMVPALAFFTIRVMDFYTNGISFDGENYTIRYSKGFYLHTVVLPVRFVTMVEVRQSFFQRFRHTCDLYIRSKSEGQVVHRCRNLSFKAIDTILF